MRAAPCAHLAQNGDEGESEIAQAVFNAWRYLPMHGPSKYPIAFEFPKLLCEHLAADGRDQFLDLTGSSGAVGEIIENDRFPFASEYLKRADYWTLVVIHDEQDVPRGNYDTK